MVKEDVPDILIENRYRLIRKIAQGGMGAVYEASCFGVEGFQKTIAIKTILQSLSSSPEFVRMFIREAKLVADLVHENIVQVYQLGKADDVYYIAMEYADGPNLAQYITRHILERIDLPIELGAFITSRVCRGLEYAHKKRGPDKNPLGIVHRDISPKNIMVTYEGVVKITDFGIAKAVDIMKPGEKEIAMGKVAYLSPEGAARRPTDRRSDVFSLGIVMFEVLTGVHPFRVKDSNETLDNIKSKHIPDPRECRSEIPEELSRTCLRALERDPAQRYQHAGQMGYELERYMYNDRFGPTNVTLSQYLRSLFDVPDDGTQDRTWTAAPTSPEVSEQNVTDTI